MPHSFSLFMVSPVATKNETQLIHCCECVSASLWLVAHAYPLIGRVSTFRLRNHKLLCSYVSLFTCSSTNATWKYLLRLFIFVLFPTSPTKNWYSIRRSNCKALSIFDAHCLTYGRCSINFCWMTELKTISAIII